MTEFRTPPPDQPWRAPEPNHDTPDASEAGKALLVGLLGGLLSAAGYLVYRRLPEEQKEKLHAQVRGVVQQRINEIRQNFNI